MQRLLDFKRHRIHARILFSLLILFSLTGNASANAGTPLIITSLLHLLFGNLIIGIFEGSVLKEFFGSGSRWCIPVMILANYASAWGGLALVNAGWWGEDLLDLDNLRYVFCAMIVVAWILTVVMEWPFIWLCFRGELGVWKRSFRISLKIQTISYLAMMAVYWYASGTSLLTGVTIAKPSDFHLPDQVEIYYIDPADGDVHRRKISGGEPAKIFDLNSDSIQDQLFVTPMTGSGDTDLKVTSGDPMPAVNVASRLAVRSVPSSDRPQDRGAWSNFGKASKLEAPAESGWEFETGFWAAQGLEATNRKLGRSILVSLETPFIMWNARNAVHIANDLVLFQLGTNQICVFDPATKRIAKLWSGRGFVAVIPRKE